MNKRGDTIVLETVIFIALNLVFGAVMTVFILNSSYGALIYEQNYAKEIALLLDEAKPGMTITLDMQEAVLIAQKYEFAGQKVSSSDALSKIVSLNKDLNLVTVSLSGRGGGYSYRYYSNYDVTLDSRGIVLQIKVEDKNA